MDTAFQSRIHVSMDYPGLSSASKKHVWVNFLKRGIEHEIDEKQLDVLAEIDLNGRQIKNLLKTAQLLANHRKAPLKYEHLKVVLDIQKRQPAAPHWYT